VLDKMKFSDWLGPEGRRTFEENFPRLKATGATNEQEFDLIRRDGSTLPVSVSSTAISNAKGEFLMSRSVVSDITRRKRADLELKNLTLRTEMILNSAGEGIYGTDLEGRTVFFNQAAQTILGFTEAEAVGQQSHTLFHHTKADGTPFPLGECSLQESLLNRKTLRMSEDLFWTKEGKAIPVELVNSPLVEQGNAVGAVVVFRDITQTKKASEEIRELNTSLERRVKEGVANLQDSQMALINIVEDLNEKTAQLESANENLKDLDRLKSLFIASMSHEFRTPLNSVIGFSTILMNDWTGSLTEEQKDLLSIILRSGRHLLALVSDVIDVSKIEAGKLESTSEDFDAYDVGYEAIAAFTEEAKKKNLTLELRAAREAIHTDRRRLLQCLLNLISNAVKYTDYGKVEVDVESVEDEAFIEFRVSDTGVGLSPGDLDKLFSPFVRIILPHRPVVPGTGLGLYLSRKLAQEVLGGDILVQSVQGKGSCFILKVPRTTERRPE
jgi:PAS domain S-box-containing protein